MKCFSRLKKEGPLQNRTFSGRGVTTRCFLSTPQKYSAILLPVAEFRNCVFYRLVGPTYYRVKDFLFSSKNSITFFCNMPFARANCDLLVPSLIPRMFPISL